MASSAHKLLLDARARGVPWSEIARLVLRSGDKPASAQLGDTRFDSARAASLSGYTANAVGRMAGALSYVERLVAAGRISDPAPLLACAYAKLELLRRIDDLSAEDGVALLPRLTAGAITTVELRRHYEELVRRAGARLPGRKASPRRLRRFLEAARDVLGPATTTLTGNSNAVLSTTTAAIRWVKPDYMFVHCAGRPRHVREVDAVMVRFFPGRVPGAVLDREMMRALSAAMFFRRLWLFVPAESGAGEQFCDELKALGTREAPSIGVAAIHGGRSPELEVLRPVSEGERLGVLRDWLISELVMRGAGLAA